jgi:archaellum component FlaC
MTAAQPDRLDRIEALLERMAIESERSKRESDERMTRIDAQLDRMTIESERSKRESDERMSRLDERMEELAQSQQATSRDVAQLVTIQQRSSHELSEAMIRLADTQEGIARLLGSLDEDRPTILRKLNTIEDKIDNLLHRENQSN